ncbi:MAG TPA: Clp protease N-terminal domain-containing protein [Acidimicrobiia bacterium]
MFERFTDRARRVFVAANDEARALGSARLGSGQLLLGLLHDPASDAGRVLVPAGVGLERARELVGSGTECGGTDATADGMDFTAQARNVVERSLREALRSGDARIGTGDLLLGLAAIPDADGARVLVALGLDLDAVRRDTLTVIARHEELRERAAVTPIVVPELSPEARRALQTALRFGTAYLGKRYAPVRMLYKASSAGGALRRVAGGPARAELEPGARSGPVPATCASCGTASPACGTLYTTASGTLVCERCIDRVT